MSGRSAGKPTRSARWRSRAPFICGALSLAMALLDGCGRSEPPPLAKRAQWPAIEVSEVTGTVSRLTKTGATRSAAAGALPAGEVLVTGPDGHAIIRLPDGRELELGAGTRLSVESGSPSEVVVRVENGRIIARLVAGGPAQPVAISVLTPHGIVRLPRTPGEASIAGGADGFVVGVSVGEVDLIDLHGRPLHLRAPERVEVSVGGVRMLPPAAAPHAAVEPPVADVAAARAPRTIVGDPVEVVLSAVQGPLLVRGPADKEFSRRRSVTATPGTAYRVAERSGRARFAGPGLNVRLGPASEGRVGDARREGGETSYDLTLSRGSSLVQLDGKQTRSVRLRLPNVEVGASAPEGATLEVIPGKQASSVTALLGEIELAVGDERHSLRAGERVEISPTGVRARPRAPASLVLPTARGLRVFAEALDEVTLTWPRDLSDASIEVARDPGFEEVVLAGRVEGQAVTIRAPARADLHWRVAGRADGAARTLLGNARFLPDRGRSVLDLSHPQNVVADTVDETVVYFQGVLPALTFTLTSKPGAARYRLRVYRAGALDTPLVQRETATTRCLLEAAALGEGRFLWHAVALDQMGRELGGGLMHKLDVVYENALNTLAIAAPKPGAPIHGSRIQVAGVAPLGSRLFVNGRATELDGKGRFQTQVERSPAVVFRLVQSNGSESYWVRRVRLGS